MLEQQNTQQYREGVVEKTFITGVEGLDKLLGEISAPYTLLVEGHPGAGKTTLAVTICYKNALRGKKCLYVSFYEDKEKLYKYMKKLGMNLAEVEAKGLLKFIRLPVSRDVDALVEALSASIQEGFDVVVVDSISVLLEAVESSAEKRAWLLNYFFQLAALLNGLVVLVAELPFGEQRLSSSSIEFVVDAALIMKYKLVDGVLTRYIELRKARGVSLHVVEAPFTIVDKRGIIAYVQPLVEEIPGESMEMSFPCSIIAEKMGHVHKNFFVNMFFPPETIYGRELLLLLLALAIKYNLKVLVVSYTTPPEQLKEAIVNLVAGSNGEARRAVKELLCKHFVFRAINPLARSIQELAMEEVALIEEVKPDIVVFHGIQVLELPGYNLPELYKQVTYLKSKNIGVVRIGSCINEEVCKGVLSISDMSFRTIREFKNGKFETYVLVYRRFRPPTAVSYEEFSKCIEEARNYVLSEVFKAKG